MEAQESQAQATAAASEPHNAGRTEPGEAQACEPPPQEAPQQDAPADESSGGKQAEKPASQQESTPKLNSEPAKPSNTTGASESRPAPASEPAAAPDPDPEPEIIDVPPPSAGGDDDEIIDVPATGASASTAKAEAPEPIAAPAPPAPTPSPTPVSKPQAPAEAVIRVMVPESAQPAPGFAQGNDHADDEGFLKREDADGRIWLEPQKPRNSLSNVSEGYKNAKQAAGNLDEGGDQQIPAHFEGKDTRKKVARSASNVEITFKPILPMQAKVFKVYNGFWSQITVASIIGLNFVISVIEAQMNEIMTEGAEQVFTVFEWAFNIIFGIELLINIYAHFFCAFWKSAWNVFDVVIVGISWVSMLGNVPGITVLRLFRAFRAFRLFNRIESIKVILIGVIKSLPGVSYAFVLLIIIMGIWSIMGVQFFRHDFPDFFGNFSKGMLTLCQMMTFDSWVSQITRPICLYYNSWACPIFFISYIFVSAIIMMQVVVAILLEKFMEASNDIKEQKAAEKLALEASEDSAEDEEWSIDDVVGDNGLSPLQRGERILCLLEEKLLDTVDMLEKNCYSLIEPPTTPGLSAGSSGNKVVPLEGGVVEEEPLEKLPKQNVLRKAMASPPSQIGIAVAICINFVLSSIKAQVLPEEGTGFFVFLYYAELILNIIFLIELVINMYANWFCAFWKNSWNVFDFVIVMISWASMAGGIPGISVLRLFRAFRVFRLFKRIESLRKIIAGIGKSLPGVSNAFVILGLVMGIWSIMGVNFFGEDWRDYFSNFFKAMLTMFQVSSFDSWSSGVTRPVIFYYGSPLVAVFFITYLFIAAIIMLNVVLAILLDEFLAAAKEFEGETEDLNVTPASEILDKIKEVDIEIEPEAIVACEERIMQRLKQLKKLVQGPVSDSTSDLRKMLKARGVDQPKSMWAKSRSY